MQTAPDVATGRAIFDMLCDGGAVIDAYRATFFFPGFGMVQDKFGTHLDHLGAAPRTLTAAP